MDTGDADSIREGDEMSSSYGRLAAIRDYWMPRNLNARVEVRVTDIDEILQELVRVTTLAAERAAPTPPAQDDEVLGVLNKCASAIEDFAYHGKADKWWVALKDARTLIAKRGAA